ncbi:T9SS type A sorting domain-containing protein [Hymenobacter setariae]|uniref:T9SS type A sorting domain-containing protein n=1 Tax=Hymenobacter setariae TaxID=2594794 RepID=A0A558BZ09_9BACT|nr:PA14 domain-containing protein [Hymenobacter setariae]TVT41756.1 T9SS type A sorting domain-containing protein [Hymenobacter setariae]
MIPLILTMLFLYILRGRSGPVCGNSQFRNCFALLLGISVLLSSVARAQSPPVVGSPGLSADYYRGYFYDQASFFTTNTPAIRNRPVEQLNFAEAEDDNFYVGNVATYYAPNRPDEFSARFQGQLYVTTTGSYTFYLGSDDAAYLWLDNNPQPIAFNKGDSFPYREVTSTWTLTAGLHTLRVDYGEHGGSQGLVLQYSGPDMPKQLIPNGVLYNQMAAAIRPTLMHFDAVATNQQVALNWETAAEENCTGFVIQKSLDGKVFTDLLRQPGGATTMMARSYDAIDPVPANGWNYYRLQQLRSDRQPVYSPIKAVEIKPVELTVSIYPVPNNGTFYLNVQPGNVGTALLKLLDMSGRQVYQQEVSLANGSLQMIEPGMSTGIYMLKLTTSAGTFSRKISLGI